MRNVLKNIISKCIIFLLIVQTLNLSIDSLGFYTPIKVTNTLHDDDYVDSMIEFLVENVMGFPKDTFSDKANPDNFSKLQQNIVHFDLKWFPNALVISDLESTNKQLVYNIPEDEKISAIFYKEVRPNPPQFLSV